MPGTFLDGGTAPLIADSLNSNVNGRYIFNVRGGMVEPPNDFDCSDLNPVVGQWGITNTRCGDFISNATAARYESTLYDFEPAKLRGQVPTYAYEVEFVANRPNETNAAASIFVAGSPIPLRSTAQWWDRAIAFNLSGTGRYSIYRYNGTARPAALQAWTVPVGVTINPPPASNTLRVESAGGMLVFSINGSAVRTLPDSYGIDQFGMGFVRSRSTTGNLATDDWMEVLDVDLDIAPLTLVDRIPNLVSREQHQANEAANNEQRGNDNPLFAPLPTNGTKPPR